MLGMILAAIVWIVSAVMVLVFGEDSFDVPLWSSWAAFIILMEIHRAQHP